MTEEQRAARLRHHMYETCEGIAEHAERIVALEELVADYIGYCGCDGEYCEQHADGSCRLLERAMKLGVFDWCLDNAPHLGGEGKTIGREIA